ncbi:MAG: nitroreductase family protein [Succinivibrio sp.]|nr:nitroreductase family protein [Succinivibrio sp.]
MVTSEELLSLIKASRSVRGYDENFWLSREDLLPLIEAARFCPSGANRQPLKYALVYEQAQVKQVRPLLHWAMALKELHLPHPGMQPTAMIVICQDLRVQAGIKACDKDVGICAQTIMLMAKAQGLGGCMIATFTQADLSRVLNLEEHLKPLLVLALGKPQEKIVLTEVKDGKTDYYRDQDDVHYVPKRALEDLIVQG